jgi:conjugal transfer pilus assembly protein TrbC
MMGVSWSIYASDSASLVLAPQEVNRIKEQVQTNKQTYHSLVADIKQHSRQYGLPHKEQVVDGAVLFVSFSMPEDLLFSLADEASIFGIPVVLNGLVEGDFKKTIEHFNQLKEEAKKQHRTFSGVSIDPVWFEQFKVQKIPALVVSHRPSSCEAEVVCAAQKYDIVYGNASIKDGLKLIARKGGVARSLAQTILENRHV